MNETFEKQFGQTIESLNELVAFIDPKDFSKVSEILARVNSLKSEFTKSHQLERHPVVAEVLEKELDQQILEFADRVPSIGSINFYVQKNLGIDEWNSILQWSSKLLNFLPLLKPIGSFGIEVSKGEMSFAVEALADFEIEAIRPQAYLLTRELLNSGVVLTFDMTENGVQFKLRWQTEKNELFTFELKDKSEVLAFDSLLGAYQIAPENLAKKDNHLIYTINQEFCFERYQNHELPDQKTEVTVLHFSFLFRPVSLIIPMKGQVLPATRTMGKPGWLPLWGGQDVDQVKIHFIDWFKLIQS